MTKARLEDLYRRGRELVIEDKDSDQSSTVWISKLNPLEAKDAGRRANAARARALIAKNNRDSDEFLDIYVDVLDMSDGEIINYLCIPLEQRKRQIIEAEVAGEDEWSKEDYLLGLTDAWEEELREVWMRDADDSDLDDDEKAVLAERKAEAQRVLDEMNRFDQQVEDKFQLAARDLRDEHEAFPRQVLEDKIMDLLFENKSNEEWLNAYSRYQVFFSVRHENDHKKRYFKDAESVSTLEPDVYIELLTAYRNLEVDIQEGKGLQETTNS